MDDFAIFEDSQHMFAWSSAKPAEIIRFPAEDLVSNSLPGSTLRQILCSGEPKYLTGARKQADDPNQVIMTRMGVAFETRFVIDRPNGVQEEVSGISALICQNLDRQEELTIRLEFTPGGNLSEVEASLAVKLYEDPRAG